MTKIIKNSSSNKINEKETNLSKSINQTHLEELLSIQKIEKGIFFEKLVKLFKQSNQKRLNELVQSVQEKNLQNINSIAHTMKSAASTLRAETMFAICEKLEEDSLNAKTDSLEDSVDALKHEFEKVCTELDTFIQQSNQNAHTYAPQ